MNSQQHWSAKDLLDPRRSATTQRPPKQPSRQPHNGHNHNSSQAFTFTSPQSAPNSRQPPPPVAFSFDAPGRNSTSIQQAHTANSNDSRSTSVSSDTQTTGGGFGIGGFYERMHNVTNRSTMPAPKRRKVDEAHENEKKAHFGGGGKGGVLGDYMKQKREEGQAEAAVKGTAPAPSTIDLTEDDAPVDPGDKEVCYGRVDGVTVYAFKVPTPQSLSSSAFGPDYWPAVKVLLRRGDKNTTQIYTVDSTREIFGNVDVNSARALCPLIDGALSIRMVAKIPPQPKKYEEAPPGSGNASKSYPLDLVLYGPKKNAIRVAAFLSQKQIYLRPPLHLEAGIELFMPNGSVPVNSVRSRTSTYGSGSVGQRTTEEIRNDVVGMFDKLEPTDSLPEMEPGSQIKTELLRHQKQGLYFMTKKEKEINLGDAEAEKGSLWVLKYGANGRKIYYNVITGQEEHSAPPQVRGGILADMMGLGKTLSILSLIVTSLNESKAWAVLSPPKPMEDEVALVRNCKTTLLVCPLSTITNWEDQISQHIVPKTLKYHIYHGPHRFKDVNKLAEFDLVITTYGSIASEFGKREKRASGTFPIAELNWFRIVLDEAHMIREQATLQSKSICQLNANRRWAVTGTPVQNRLDDLGALMKFLRLKPFDEKRGFAQYILAPCRNADPDILPKIRLLVDSITIRRLKDRIDLPQRHDSIIKLRFSPEEQQLYDVFSKNASDRVAVLTDQKSKSIGGKAYVHILQSILRLRLICAHGKDLLGEEDLKIMEGINKASAIDLDSDEDEVDKPGLSEKAAYDMYDLMRRTDQDNCAECNAKILAPDGTLDDGCHKNSVIAHLTPCFHLICNKCIDSYSASLTESSLDGSRGTCPLCTQFIQIFFFPLRQSEIDIDDAARAEAKDGKAKHKRLLTQYTGPHTKTLALLEDLLLSQSESMARPDEPPIKSVVFSGWTSHLDLIALALENAGIQATRLDGKMSRGARTQAMETFKTDPKITVILVSIMAGGLGLNLTTANKVYVMEPQYNPAAEAQAIDRVHRLGQKREVWTVRYIMEDSFEVKMLELQDKKTKLATLSMDREKDVGGRGYVSKEEANRKKLEDLKSLFK